VTALKTSKTFDGVTVLVQPDGDVTDRIGRGASRVRLSVSTALIVAGEAPILLWAELPRAIKAAAKAERRGGGLAEILAAVRS
jgi:hypothetical protein